MKKIILLTFASLFLACGVRETENYLNNGDYDRAINNAIDHLSSRKNAKGKQEYIYLLQDAFEKAQQRDLDAITILVKESNQANFERVYNLYNQLQERQERIKPLLPLKLLKENRNAEFIMNDYSDEIIASKNGLSGYLYANSLKLMESQNKLDIRQAHDDLIYLDKLNPNYKDVRKLIDDAKFKGTDYIHVYTKNETNMIIPIRLQDDLLNFGTFGLNEKWTVYHNNKQKNIDYDFGMLVNFRQINISPEQIKEKEFIKEKQVKDGTQNLLDSNGNIVKDSLGKPIKVDKFKTIRINIYEFRQFKSVQVTAKVDYVDYKTGQLIETFPLASEYIFEHIYANYNGDKNACDESYLPFFDKRAVPFPSNEQMVFDSGEDLKAKLKDIITRNRFRR